MYIYLYYIYLYMYDIYDNMMVIRMMIKDDGELFLWYD